MGRRSQRRVVGAASQEPGSHGTHSRWLLLQPRACHRPQAHPKQRALSGTLWTVALGREGEWRFCSVVSDL